MFRIQAGCFLGVMIMTAAGRPGRGESREFDFKDPKGVNAMTFMLDTPIEPIVGLAGGIAGKITFDPEKPHDLRGRLTVEAASLIVPQPKMQEHLHSADWLDVARYPQICFEIVEARNVRTIGPNVFEMDLVGDFSCRGVTARLAVRTKVSYLPDHYGKRMHRGAGDLLVLRAEFVIRRSDFGIRPDVPAEAMADEIQIRAGIVGMWEKK